MVRMYVQLKRRSMLARLLAESCRAEGDCEQVRVREVMRNDAWHVQACCYCAFFLHGSGTTAAQFHNAQQYEGVHSAILDASRTSAHAQISCSLSTCHLA